MGVLQSSLGSLQADGGVCGGHVGWRQCEAIERTMQLRGGSGQQKFGRKIKRVYPLKRELAQEKRRNYIEIGGAARLFVISAR